MSDIRPLFHEDWYKLGIWSKETSDNGGDIGNQAYRDWMERTILAAGRDEIDWLQVTLAVILDREVRADEARRTVEDTV